MNMNNIISISLLTSFFAFLLWVTPIIIKAEKRWEQYLIFSTKKKFRFPFEKYVDQWLQQSYVNMSAKQFVFLILLFNVVPIGFTFLFSSLGILPVFASVYFTISIIYYPFQKRKKISSKIDNEVRIMKQYIAKLYERHVPLNEMIEIIYERLPDDSILKLKLEKVQLRSQSINTLTESIKWLSDQIKAPSLQLLANILVQSSRYADLPLETRLVEMAKQDRNKIVINFEKIAEHNKMRALLEGGFFIALPIIALLVLVIFYYVFQNFQNIHI